MQTLEQVAGSFETGLSALLRMTLWVWRQANRTEDLLTLQDGLDALLKMRS